MERSDSKAQTTRADSPVTGATRLFGVIGTPVTPLKSPEVWTSRFIHRGVNAVFLPFDAPPDRADVAAHGLLALSNLHGLVVTMPHKQAAYAWPEHLSHAARRAGAVSMLRRRRDGEWEGDLCEEEAVIRALSAVSYSPAGRSAMVIGAGGAGTSIAWALVDQKAERIGIVDSDEGKAEALVSKLRLETDARVEHVRNDPSGFDLVVNATPAGMSANDPLPTEVARLEPDSVVLDMVVEPRPTPFLRQAAERGITCVDGMNVLTQTVTVIGTYFGLDDW
jgi:shikimate dehydrogenase